MNNAIIKVPFPRNEPVRAFAPGDPDMAGLMKSIQGFLSMEMEIPLIIGGQEVRTGDLGECICPHDHGHVLARYHKAGLREVAMAISSAKSAWREWSEIPWPLRVSIFLKAADLLATEYRPILLASTMLNQSKTIQQAEIDAACELIDFFRFNAHYMTQLYAEQPDSPEGTWNTMEYRPLEGFVFAVTPFNFTSIAGNLPTSPVIMGNVAIWKPASTAVYSGYHIMELLMAAGLPPGVINFVPGDGAAVGEPVVADPTLAGVHFTGGTSTFQTIWRSIGANIATYRAYPRIVGETGGKDFVVAHPSASTAELATALTRGAFEYQGQKCSAASRAYIPASIWPVVRDQLVAQVKSIRVGQVTDCQNFMGAVIDAGAFKTISAYIASAAKDPECSILVGGDTDDSRGYFISPTVVVTTNPGHRLMTEEIFGPVLTVYIYPDQTFEETLTMCDETSPYALTGSIFAQDRSAINTALRALRHSAGNFYINDKPTGAVVNQQPFGGSRASGTNDKAGSKFNLMRWTSVRTIKENFIPPSDYRYPFICR